MPPLALGDADERELPAARLPRLYIAIEARRLRGKLDGCHARFGRQAEVAGK